MTHDELVSRAEHWLRKSIRCGVVLTEARGSGSEVPDAIGWKGGYARQSYLIECKTSRGDYRADARKFFRRESWVGVGRWRYFMAAPGLIDPRELPPRWGLLEAGRSRIRVLRKAKRWDLDASGSCLGVRNEMAILLTELRLVQIVRNGGTISPSRSGLRVTSLLTPPGQEPPV